MLKEGKKKFILPPGCYPIVKGGHQLLLAIDVGNTNIVMGLYAGSKLVHNWRIGTDAKKTADEYGALFSMLLQSDGATIKEVAGAIISSVVPPINASLERAVMQYIRVKPLFVGPGIKTGINIRLDNPRELGADRIVNAVAAFHLYGGPVIIVDFGTATTFCALTESGDYLGGAIGAGVNISMEALFAKAAQLSSIKIRKPDNAIGRNTVAAMESGVYYGFVGQTRELIKRIKDDMIGNPRVIATGGLAGLIGSELPIIDTVNPHLTLEGLKILGELNLK